MEKKSAHLGDEVQDVVSGLKGIVTALVVYLNGCVQFEVSPKAQGNGTMAKSLWVDTQQLKVLKSNPLKLRPAESGMPDWPDDRLTQSTPRKKATPKRRRSRGGPQGGSPPGMGHP